MLKRIFALLSVLVLVVSFAGCFSVITKGQNENSGTDITKDQNENSGTNPEEITRFVVKATYTHDADTLAEYFPTPLYDALIIVADIQVIEGEEMPDTIRRIFRELEDGTNEVQKISIETKTLDSLGKEEYLESIAEYYVSEGFIAEKSLAEIEDVVFVAFNCDVVFEDGTSSYLTGFNTKMPCLKIGGKWYADIFYRLIGYEPQIPPTSEQNAPTNNPTQQTTIDPQPLAPANPTVAPTTPAERPSDPATNMQVSIMTTVKPTTKRPTTRPTTKPTQTPTTSPKPTTIPMPTPTPPRPTTSPKPTTIPTSTTKKPTTAKPTSATTKKPTTTKPSENLSSIDASAIVGTWISARRKESENLLAYTSFTLNADGTCSRFIYQSYYDRNPSWDAEPGWYVEGKGWPTELGTYTIEGTTLILSVEHGYIEGLINQYAYPLIEVDGNTLLVDNEFGTYYSSEIVGDMDLMELCEFLGVNTNP